MDDLCESSRKLVFLGGGGDCCPRMSLINYKLSAILSKPAFIHRGTPTHKLLPRAYSSSVDLNASQTIFAEL